MKPPNKYNEKVLHIVLCGREQNSCFPPTQKLKSPSQYWKNGLVTITGLSFLVNYTCWPVPVRAVNAIVVCVRVEALQ